VISGQWLVDSGQWTERRDRKTSFPQQREVLIELFQKVMLACGKLRLCLVGSRLHFPSENRQSRARTESF